MPTCVTLAAVSQSRNASSSRLTVRNVRTSLRARAPAAPISRQATTVSWCTSSPQHRSIIACIRASLPQKATVTPQVSSRHCHTCSPFPGATKNSTSMQRGPDCLSGSNATQNASASTRSPIGNSDKPARAATIFNHNGARPAQPGCLAGNEDDLDQAIAYAISAGERADALLAFEDAVEFFQAALDSMEQRTEVDPAEQCRVSLLFGEAVRKSGDFLKAQKVLWDTARRAEALGQFGIQAQAALAYEHATWRAERLSDLPPEQLLAEALRHVPEDVTRLRIELMAGLSRALLHAGAI